MREYLLFIFEFLVKNQNIELNFFAINSYAVNAKFLSRYIARKLKQNYTVNELMNPIKRELYFIGSTSKMPLSGYLYMMRKGYYDSVSDTKFRKGLLKIVFLFYLLLQIVCELIFI